MALPAELQAEAGQYCVHPALLDAALHAAGLIGGEAPAGHVMLPFAWNGVRVHASGAAEARVRVRKIGPDAVSIHLADISGAPVATVASLGLRPVPVAGLGAEPELKSLYRISWKSIALPAVELAGLDVQLVDTTDWPHAEGPDGLRQLTGRLLSSVQEWDSRAGAAATLLVLTRHGVSVAENEGSDPAAAALWGLLRAVQAEQPGRIVVVDTDGEIEPRRIRALVSLGEAQLAIRGQEVLLPRLTRARDAAAGATPIRPLNPRGTVLITGGTGALGRVVARHLTARHDITHLVLASRHGPGAEGAEELQAELTASGAQVSIVTCDVSDPDELAGLLKQIPQEHPLTAVVHTAGVLDDGIISDLTPARFDGVLRPKADAAWHLHRLTAEQDLAAFVLFSSAAGVLGSPGQANYAAANSFLDGLAEFRRAAGLPATSLAWGLWGEVSGLIGHLDDIERSRLDGRGAVALSAAEGMRLFDAALALGDAVLLPAKLNLASLARQQAGRRSPLLNGLVRLPRKMAHRGPVVEPMLAERLLRVAVGERARLMLELVLSQIGGVLGRDHAERVEPEQTFKEIGFDSMLAVQLRNRLSEVTAIRLPATLIFDYPTPASLAAELLVRLLPDSRPEVDGSATPENAPADSRELELLAEMDPARLIARALGAAATSRNG